MQVKLRPSEYDRRTSLIRYLQHINSKHIGILFTRPAWKYVYNIILRYKLEVLATSSVVVCITSSACEQYSSKNFELT